MSSLFPGCYANDVDGFRRIRRFGVLDFSLIVLPQT
jgi:hypothetical protein